jgi:hypothetical protein
MDPPNEVHCLAFLRLTSSSKCAIELSMYGLHLAR